MLDHFESAAKTDPRDILSDIEQQTAVEALEDACEKMQPPLHRLEHALHPWVTFLIMPLFALANAGVSLSGELGSILTQPITFGVMLGLVLGKPIRVTLASWLAVRWNLATLPEDVSWKHIHGAGWLARIGIHDVALHDRLAFNDDAHLTEAKLGILVASRRGDSSVPYFSCAYRDSLPGISGGRRSRTPRWRGCEVRCLPELPVRCATDYEVHLPSATYLEKGLVVAISDPAEPIRPCVHPTPPVRNGTTRPPSRRSQFTFGSKTKS